MFEQLKELDNNLITADKTQKRSSKFGTFVIIKICIVFILIGRVTRTTRFVIYHFYLFKINFFFSSNVFLFKYLKHYFELTYFFV